MGFRWVVFVFLVGGFLGVCGFLMVGFCVLGGWVLGG